ncbi:hypothetical protein FNH22_31410 [Fulvivirga sp. M361]|uniref:hypothetical protein n=1 Tax=Fulvivirga sp. M361 TaxID=2594266 RepID=UPI00117A5863|nr:hypothetical protein [Fulvivirga sp. M361]TRX45784.1 hypothetical protein FNH22_31410 [Fulvivirga sp. M361]
MLNDEIEDSEFLFRGVVTQNWDFENDRPTSATFKDSKGVSVDRDGGRDDKDCIDKIKTVNDFHAICKVMTKDVRDLDAVVFYKPVPENDYHSEIHDSNERIQMKGKKPSKIRERSIVVYKK